jgi:F-type H+-transporting ATPase subunit b
MKRFKLLILATAITAFAIFGFSSTASAEGDSGLSHAAEECIEQIEAADSIDVECQEAPNQLLPEINEVIYGGLAFLIVFIFLWKFGMPAIKAGMAARSEKIQGDLDAAASERTEASAILTQYQAQLADARTESARIIEEARQAADEVRANLQAKAEADIAELRARATADIEAAKLQAVADLRGEVTALAIGAAEQVVGRNLDAETNAALVEAYINQVGANS